MTSTEKPVEAVELRELARAMKHMAKIARDGMADRENEIGIRYHMGIIDGLEMGAGALMMLSVVGVAKEVEILLPDEPGYVEPE